MGLDMRLVSSVAKVPCLGLPTVCIPNSETRRDLFDVCDVIMVDSPAWSDDSVTWCCCEYPRWMSSLGQRQPIQDLRRDLDRWIVYLGNDR